HFEITAHHRVVKENSAAAVLAGEHATLIRKINARRVDKVHNRHAAAHRDLLRAKNFAHSFGPPGSRLHRGIVGNHDSLAVGYAAYPRHDAGRRSLALVEIVGNQQTDLLEVGLLIK